MQTFNFSIQSLLSVGKGDNIRGPMSPLLFAQEMATGAAFKFNRLARVWFDNEHIHQNYEDGVTTGYDTLIIGTQYENDLWLSLWVDSGIGGIPVAMRYRSDTEITLTSVYERSEFIEKLSAGEVQLIFNHIFDNPELIAIANRQTEPESE